MKIHPQARALIADILRGVRVHYSYLGWLNNYRNEMTDGPEEHVTEGAD